MATQNKNSQPFPPKRGKIKAQIFESIVKTVKSTVTSIAGGSSDSGKSSSAGGTPPASSYSSDGNPEA